MEGVLEDVAVCEAVLDRVDVGVGVEVRLDVGELLAVADAAAQTKRWGSSGST